MMDLPLIFGIGAILLILLLAFVFSRGGAGNSARKKEIYSKLLTLEEELKSTPTNGRDIIVRLDNLLAKALQTKYLNNDSCGQNLKRAHNLFAHNFYNQLWTYHKLRNKVVHEDRDVSATELDNAYSVFKKAIYKILG